MQNKSETAVKQFDKLFSALYQINLNRYQKLFI